MIFHDRVQAGRSLAQQLAHLGGEAVVVVGLPRGGVVAAAEVAEALGAPLDVVVVRKLGLPWQPELAMGAVAEDGSLVLNQDILEASGMKPGVLAEVEHREAAHVREQAALWRRGRSRTSLSGQVAVVVDDGVATGATAAVACKSVRAAGATRVVLAVPVGPPDLADRLGGVADDIVCAWQPAEFRSVGEWYENFAPVSDDDVEDLLARLHSRGVTVDDEVVVPVGPVRLPGHLTAPPAAVGVVVFAHGSGSSRQSPRNQTVARKLNFSGLGTLLLDLLTVDEEAERSNVFDIDLLTTRLTDATRWLRDREPEGTPIGYLGASTGAAAALSASAELGTGVSAVVSRGGRPDLAGPRLSAVRAPTLLIVGGNDEAVLALNQRAQALLTCPNELRIVPGAGDLFSEPGALQEVAVLASRWFHAHMAGPHGPGTHDRC
jgi:putative phosphoribosyl transferase